MLRSIALGGVFAASLCCPAPADEIVGQWRTKPGDTAAISDCGSAFCITLRDGKYAGRRIGKVTALGDGAYEGTITNPQDGRTYNGTGQLIGSALRMSGCILGGLICKSQTWRKLQ